MDQDYDNKRLIVLNDQEGVNLSIPDCPSDITVVNHPQRFDSLGEKRNHLNRLGLDMCGDLFCVWDDDDLYTPWRISASVDLMKRTTGGICKPKTAYMSTHNKNYAIVSNLFHSQACITRKYMEENQYTSISVGEDIDFERNARVESIDPFPMLWYVYRWGLNLHHLSGIGNEKDSWEKSLQFKSYNDIKGDVEVLPKFGRDYWKDIGAFLATGRGRKATDKWRWKFTELFA
jgi:hypothetical protein